MVAAVRTPRVRLYSSRHSSQPTGRVVEGRWVTVRPAEHGNPIYRALAGAILVPLTRVAHGPRPINGVPQFSDFLAIFFVFFCFFLFRFFLFFFGFTCSDISELFLKSTFLRFEQFSNNNFRITIFEFE
jgi:hypothetical protein